jgi:hypothetical protein
MVDTLREGTAIASEIPADLEGVRAFRIVVGDVPPPRGDLIAVRRWDRVKQTVFRRPLVPLSPLGSPPAPESPAVAPIAPFEPFEPATPAETTTAAAPPAVGSTASLIETVDEAARAEEPVRADQPSAPTESTDSSGGAWYDASGQVFLLVAVGLCLSIGANLFLFWITWDTRRHYRNLLRRGVSPG